MGCAWMSEPPTQITPDPAETTSLFGEPLRPALISPEARDTLEARLARARTNHERDPSNPDALIWLGRRTAYLGRYRAAIAIFSEGIASHPHDARLYRHRGHRYITLRLFDAAIRDLEQATLLIAGKPDSLEPDGIPNARNTPTSTSHSNIWYHLGLAYYLTGDFENARRCYQQCLRFSNNPDQLCATTYWLHLSLLRLGRADEARAALEPIRADMDIIENADYHRLLLLCRGEAAADTLLRAARNSGGVSFATTGYGVAAWRLARQEKKPALSLMREVLAAGTWAAFGYIACEADLERMGEGPE